MPSMSDYLIRQFNYVLHSLAKLFALRCTFFFLHDQVRLTTRIEMSRAKSLTNKPSSIFSSSSSSSSLFSSSSSSSSPSLLSSSSSSRSSSSSSSSSLLLPCDRWLVLTCTHTSCYALVSTRSRGLVPCLPRLPSPHHFSFSSLAWRSCYSLLLRHLLSF